MRTKIPGIMRAVDGMPWAIVPAKLEAMLEMLELRASGEARDPAFAAAPKRAPLTVGGGKIAVIPLYGVVCQRANMVSDVSGGTSTELVGKQIAAACEDPAVTAVILDVDSPGGAVDGVEELASKIYGLRGSKPMIAVSNTLNASAAYWISSACDEVVATPSATVGSIGVFTVRVDTSRADANDGIAYHVVKAGEHKAEDLPFEPVTDDELAAIQERVDELYGSFVSAVARHRGTTADAVRSGYGKGRTLSARKALAAKMIDRIATLDDTIARVAGMGRPKPSATSGYAQVAIGGYTSVTFPPTNGGVGQMVTTQPAALVWADGTMWRLESSGMAVLEPAASTVNHQDDPTPGPANDPARSPVGDAPSTTPAQADGTDPGDGYEPDLCPECGTKMDANGVCPYCGYVDPDGPSAADRTAPDSGGPGDPITTDPSNPRINPGDNLPDGALHGGAGRAASRAASLPGTNGPQGQGEAMPDGNGTAAVPGAAPESTLKQVMALAKENGRSIEDVERWTAEGATVAQVSREIMAGYRDRARPVAGSPSVTNVTDREADRPFKTIGEQLVAVVQAGKGMRLDRRLLAVNQRAAKYLNGEERSQFQASISGTSEGVGSDGGFFIQPELLPGVIDPIYKEDPILSRVFRIPCGANTNGVKYNVVDETSRATGSRWGGIQMYWQSEGDAPTASKYKLRLMELNLKRLGGLAYLTEELTMDAPAAEALLTRAFSEETQFMLTAAFFAGTGVGQPQGFKVSGSLITQAIEATQTIANSSNFLGLNTSKMLARIPSPLWPDVIWVYQQELLPYLMNATIGASGTAVPIFTSINSGFTQRPFDMIMGRPAYPSEFCEAVGTPGDMYALVPSQYHVLEKGGPEQATSIHVRFINFENTLRILQRLDGASVWRQAVTPYKGANTRSPFVNLNTRS